MDPEEEETPREDNVIEPSEDSPKKASLDKLSPAEISERLHRRQVELFKYMQDTVNNIDDRMQVIEKTNIALDVINYKIYELQCDFRKLTDELKLKKEALISTTPIEEQVAQYALDLVDLDDEVDKLAEDQLKEIQNYNEKKVELQERHETATDQLDTALEKFKNLYGELRMLAADMVKESYPITAEFEKDQEKYGNLVESFVKLQNTAWTIPVLEHKISVMLENVGLKMTRAGSIMTQSGRIMTIEDARNEHLLDEVDVNWQEIFPNKFPKIDQLDDTIKVVKSGTNSSLSVSSKGSTDLSRLSTEDVNYLKEHLGKPLTLALAEITAVQPKDPIHYLGHWLFKYRYNQEADIVNKAEVDALTAERERIAKEKWHKFLEDEAKNVLLELIIRAEEQAIQNELIRIEQEMMEAEENTLDDEARDKFENYPT